MYGKKELMYGHHCYYVSGVGWAILGLDLVANVYYILLIALGLLYMIYSLRAHLPWETCDHSWNTPGNTNKGFSRPRQGKECDYWPSLTSLGVSSI